MAVRGRYRHDGACHYGEVESGLNKLSLARFERVVEESGLETIERHYVAVKKLQFLTRVPLVRELTTVLVSTVLTKSQRAGGPRHLPTSSR